MNLKVKRNGKNNKSERLKVRRKKEVKKELLPTTKSKVKIKNVREMRGRELISQFEKMDVRVVGRKRLSVKSKIMADYLIAKPKLTIMEAYKKAGYYNENKWKSFSVAKSIVNSSIFQKYFKEMLRQTDVAKSMTKERILTEEACIAFSDPGQLLEDDGSLKKIRELPEEVRRAVAGITVTDTYSKA